jgi:hypothetical protein
MIIPTREDSHIQNKAPGPPTAIAVATPPIFPFPIIPPSEARYAWKGVIFPSPSPFLLVKLNFKPRKKLEN